MHAIPQQQHPEFDTFTTKILQFCCISSSSALYWNPSQCSCETFLQGPWWLPLCLEPHLVFACQIRRRNPKKRSPLSIREPEILGKGSTFDPKKKIENVLQFTQRIIAYSIWVFFNCGHWWTIFSHSHKSIYLFYIILASNTGSIQWILYCIYQRITLSFWLQPTNLIFTTLCYMYSVW